MAKLCIEDWDGPLELHQVDDKPERPLKITFENNCCVEKLGQELTPTQVKHKPCIEWEGMDPNGWHTCVFTDPDVPSRENPSIGEWHHWIVVNMKGNDLDSGTTLSEYVGSGPRKDTGLHRYTILVYKQPGPMKFDEPILGNRSTEHREKFKTKQFRKKYKFGRPLAGMCYQAQWDPYVPEIYRQLGAE